MNLYDQAKTIRQISNEGLESIKEFEGYRSTAYLDSAGIWTVGYGSTRIHGRAVKKGDVVTQVEALEQLHNDVKTFSDAVNLLVTVYVSQAQFDALCSLTYNIGATAFEESTLLRLLNDGRYEQAAMQFDRWVFAAGHQITGLINRRARERELFERDI